MPDDAPGRAVTDPVRTWVVLSGLCMLIPLPLLDDWAATRCTRRAVRELGRQHGLELAEAPCRALVDDPFSIGQGCLTLMLWPLKKLFRTVLYFLTIKDVLDRIAIAGLKVEMVRVALLAGLVPDRVPAVRASMDEVLAGVHTSPVLRWLLRHPRPAVEGFGGAVGWMLVQSGAGLVLPRFSAQLESHR